MMIVKDLIKFAGTEVDIKYNLDDYRLGFYHAAMTQRHAVNRRTVFKMAHSKIRLTANDFELYVSAPINTPGIHISAGLHMQITGNKISVTTAGINIGGVSP